VAPEIKKVVKLHYSKYYGIKHLGKGIADVVWSPDYLNGIVRELLIAHGK
jgi:hypothetical protein